MNEDCRQLQRQVKHLHKRFEFLQNRSFEYRKMMTEMIEINDFLSKVRIFMLRLFQTTSKQESTNDHLFFIWN